MADRSAEFHIDENVTIKVFVTYCWDSVEHQEKVLSFVDWLRKEGFEAQFDKSISETESATNFKVMMHRNINASDKIIVVLASGYKQKAERFEGGVGQEYEYILSDIQVHPQKYILVVFNGRSTDSTPLAFTSREILDLSNPGEREKLFSKLMDFRNIELSPVAQKKPKLSAKPIKDFLETVSSPQNENLNNPFTYGLKITSPKFGERLTNPVELCGTFEIKPEQGTFYAIEYNPTLRTYWPKYEIVFNEKDMTWQTVMGMGEGDNRDRVMLLVAVGRFGKQLINDFYSGPMHMGLISLHPDVIVVGETRITLLKETS